MSRGEGRRSSAWGPTPLRAQDGVPGLCFLLPLHVSDLVTAYIMAGEILQVLDLVSAYAAEEVMMVSDMVTVFTFLGLLLASDLVTANTAEFVCVV